MKFEEWKEIGDMLKHIRGKLMDYDFKGMTKKEWRKHPVTKAKKHLDRLRNELDNTVFMEHPEQDTQKLCNIFYGPREVDFLDKKVKEVNGI